MTRLHFNHAAEIVKAILNGEWTSEPPAYLGPKFRYINPHPDHIDRAIQTAEAFVMLFSAFSDRFDTQKFLMACGLAESTAKKRRAS